MGLIKCPRCELNYMLDTDKMCSVCKREVRGESEQDEMLELCSECGENPVVPGQELCAYCLKELAQRDSDTQSEETVVTDTSTIGGIDSVSTMDEIELDLDEDMGGESFAEDDDGFFGDDDDEDDEDDMSGEDR
ncbi:MAG: hypothetical protein Q4G06_02365 [Clostridia bacterium]|nr:hypothetical protein [Clostridia bacterium]